MRPMPKCSRLRRGILWRRHRRSRQELSCFRCPRFEALHDVVRAGKARYIGASSMYAWQFAKLQHTAALHGWTRFISMQAQYNLLTREDEREMYPLCADLGVGALPWSPLARGKLTRDWDQQSDRFESDPLLPSLYGQFEASDRRIAEEVRAIAAERGTSRAQVALAWLLHQPVVSSPVVGATKLHHLDDAVAAALTRPGLRGHHRLLVNADEGFVEIVD